MFCPNCGSRIENNSVYCDNCGLKQIIDSVSIKNKSKFFQNKKLVLLIIISILIISLVGISTYYNYTHTAKKTVNSFLNAIKESDYKKVKSLIDSNSQYLTDETVSLFVNWLNENEYEYQNIRNSLIYAYREASVEDFTESFLSSSSDAYTIISEKFLWLKTSKIHIKGCNLSVHAKAGTELVIQGIKNTFTAEADELIEIEKLLPGVYTAQFNLDTPFGEIHGSDSINLNCNCKIDITNNFDAAIYTIKTSSLSEGNYSINGVDMGQFHTIKGYFNTQPLPPGKYEFEIYKMFPWGKYIEKGNVSDETALEETISLTQDIINNKSALNDMANTIDNFNTTSIMEGKTGYYNNIFKLLKENSKAYNLFKSRNANNNAKTEVRYDRMIMNTELTILNDSLVKIDCAEYYTYPNYNREVLWNYELTYENGKWLIENYYNPGWYFNRNFIENKNSIVITHE